MSHANRAARDMELWKGARGYTRETELENGVAQRRRQRSAKGPEHGNPSEKTRERNDGDRGGGGVENTRGEKGIHRDG